MRMWTVQMPIVQETLDLCGVSYVKREYLR